MAVLMSLAALIFGVNGDINDERVRLDLEEGSLRPAGGAAIPGAGGTVVTGPIIQFKLVTARPGNALGSQDETVGCASAMAACAR